MNQQDIRWQQRFSNYKKALLQRKRSTNPTLFSLPLCWLNPVHANSTATRLPFLLPSWQRASHAKRGATRCKAPGHLHTCNLAKHHSEFFRHRVTKPQKIGISRWALGVA
jgi:hypothetical protein